MFEIKGGFRFNENWVEESLDEWMTYLHQDLVKYWEREKDPNTGRPWEPLKPGYKRWKTRNYGNLPKLMLSGEMLGTTTLRREGQRVVANMPNYGGFHMTGTSKMSARPWLGVPPVAMKQLARVSMKSILRQPRKR